MSRHQFKLLRRCAMAGLVSSLIFAASPSSLSLATDGHTDQTFGSSGVTSVSIAPNGDTTSDVAVQSDGKIIVVGSGSYAVGTGSYDFVLARFNSDGSLDTNFSGDGVVNTDLDTNSVDELNAITLQSNGKILAIGSSNSGGITYVAVVRYNTNGTIDTSFDGDGKLLLHARANGTFDIGTDILVKSNGNIVLVGSSYKDNVDPNLAYDEPFVIEITSDGTGVIFYALVSVNRASIPYTAAIQQDGTIVLAGRYTDNVDKLAMWRVNSNGQVDTNFGVTGTLLISQASSAHSLVLQTDGKIVIGGTIGTSPTLKTAVLRFSPNGELDSTFGGDGIYENSFSNGDDYINDVVLRPSGQIVAVGAVVVNNFEKSLVLQLTPSGVLDTTFSSDGFEVITIGSNESRGISTAIQNDGKVLVAAVAFFGSNADLAVMRINPPSSISTLSSLSVVGASFAETFLSSTTSYSASVPNTTTSITLTPTKSQPDSSIQINGVAVASGSASADLPLTVGANVISVVVTAQDAITQTTYTVTIARAAAAASAPTESASGGATTPTTVVSVPATTSTTVVVSQPIIDATAKAVTVKMKKTITAKALLASRAIKLASTSKVVVSVKSTSKKYCIVNGTSVKGLRKGACTVVIAVTPKATKTVKKPKTTKTTVILRVA